MASGKTKEMRSVKKQEKKGPNMRKTKEPGRKREMCGQSRNYMIN